MLLVILVLLVLLVLLNRSTSSPNSCLQSNYVFINDFPPGLSNLIKLRNRREHVFNSPFKSILLLSMVYQQMFYFLPNKSSIKVSILNFKFLVLYHLSLSLIVSNLGYLSIFHSIIIRLLIHYIT